MSYAIGKVFASDKKAYQAIDDLLEQEGIRRDKNLDYTYRNLNERNKIENLEEKDSLDFKIGSKYSNENIWVSTNLGKDFGENDNRYVEFNFGYRF